MYYGEGWGGAEGNSQWGQNKSWATLRKTTYFRGQLSRVPTGHGKPGIPGKLK